MGSAFFLVLTFAYLLFYGGACTCACVSATSLTKSLFGKPGQRRRIALEGKVHPLPGVPRVIDPTLPAVCDELDQIGNLWLATRVPGHSCWWQKIVHY